VQDPSVVVEKGERIIMVHIDPDFKTKKAFKEAFKAGREIYTYSSGIFPSKSDGRDTVEAPAAYHTWYASVEVKNGKIVKIHG
jgi:hypothetical protein